MNYKSIFTPYVARNLLRMGNPIFDIKPDKNNSSKTKVDQYFSDILKKNYVLIGG